MQTLNTDTKVESETPEQIAAQIVAMYYPDDDELEGAILSALRNEREACAKVADTIRRNSRTMTARNTAMTIAVAIREGR